MLLLKQQFSTVGNWRNITTTGFGDPKVSARDPKMGRGTPVEKYCFIELDSYRCIFKIIIFCNYVPWKNLSHFSDIS